MSNRRHLLSLIGLIAFMGPAASATNSIDGTYIGDTVLTEGDPAACGANGTVAITIQGEQLTFTNNTVKDYVAGFFPRPDGSFGQLSAVMGGQVVVIRGHVRDGVLDSDVIGAHCTHHWHLEKRS
jgi:hypothetical protein